MLKKYFLCINLVVKSGLSFFEVQTPSSKRGTPHSSVDVWRVENTYNLQPRPPQKTNNWRRFENALLFSSHFSVFETEWELRMKSWDVNAECESYGLLLMLLLLLLLLLLLWLFYWSFSKYTFVYKTSGSCQLE